MTAGPSARPPWDGSRVLLGVTGGIAAYKSVQLARDLTRLGAGVDTVLTRSAERFVGALSFQGVTGRPVYTDLFSAEGAARHIRLGRESDVVCVAPATADLIARAAAGRADDLLTTTLLATTAPVILCPAMNDRMWAHSATRANVEHVKSVLGYRIAGPAEGPLAVGEADGAGRMIEPGAIVEHIGRALTSGGLLTGRRVLVTAGPTREPLDPVRFLGNRSSGRMGWAVARGAWRRGAEVMLVAGPTALDDPVGVETVRVETAEEMREAVAAVVHSAEVCVFAAAVADYRPRQPAAEKLKSSAVGPELEVALTATPDVAASTRDRRRAGAVVVGFALETGSLVENARAKLEAKGFDLLVANDATEDGAGFEVETNRVTLLERSGEPEPLPLLSKDAVAERILDRVERILEAR